MRTCYKAQESQLCGLGDLEGWDGGLGGRSKREKNIIGYNIYTKFTSLHYTAIHFIIQQKLIQHFKALIFQF